MIRICLSIFGLVAAFVPKIATACTGYSGPDWFMPISNFINPEMGDSYVLSILLSIIIGIILAAFAKKLHWEIAVSVSALLLTTMYVSVAIYPMC